MLDRLFAQALVSGQHAATPAPLLLEDMSDDATPMCRVILGREARDVSWQDFADNGLGTALSIVILARLCSTGQCDSRKAKLADKEAHRPS